MGSGASTPAPEDKIANASIPDEVDYETGIKFVHDLHELTDEEEKQAVKDVIASKWTKEGEEYAKLSKADFTKAYNDHYAPEPAAEADVTAAAPAEGSAPASATGEAAEPAAAAAVEGEAAPAAAVEGEAAAAAPAVEGEAAPVSATSATEEAAPAADATPAAAEVAAAPAAEGESYDAKPAEGEEPKKEE